MSNSTKKSVAPEKKLFELCREKAGSAVWAIGAGMSKEGVFQWEVYVEDKKKMKKIPKTFDGFAVFPILAPRPK